MLRWFFNDRFILVISTLLVFLAMVTWFNIYNQEDPSLPYRNGQIEFSYPGASANEVERSATRIIERGLSSNEEIMEIDSTSMSGGGTIELELSPDIYDTDRAWQRIRNDLSGIAEQLPSGLRNMQVFDKISDTQGIVIALTGNYSLLELRMKALEIKEALLSRLKVRDIRLVGDPGMRLDVIFPEHQQRSLGVSPLTLSELIKSNGNYQPLNKLRGASQNNTIEAPGIYLNTEDVASLALIEGKNSGLTLGQIASLKMTADPFAERSFWHDGQRSIGLAITLPPNKMRVTDVREKFERVLNEIRLTHPDTTIDLVFFQPEWTKRRIDGLMTSLVVSFLAVAIVLFLSMNWRLALIVSLSIPVTAATTMILYGGMFSGVLEQMSVAGMVLSLGLVVDNSIVSAELIQTYRQQGMKVFDASKKAFLELWRPLLCSSLTTIAAFLPMLLAEGDVADFIRTIPVIVITAIASSLVVALTFVPAFSRLVLSRSLSTYTKSWTFKPLSRVLNWPKMALAGCLLVLAILASFQTLVGGEFFPKTSRNTAIIDIELDYGKSHDATLNTAQQLTALLKEQPEVTYVASFVGGSGPRFYYNLSPEPEQSHIARLVFHTQEAKQVPPLVERLNAIFRTKYSNIYIKAKELGQGPPVASPIEVFLLGDDRTALVAASKKVKAVLNAHKDTDAVRLGASTNATSMKLKLKHKELAIAGVSQQEISAHLQWMSIGVPAGELSYNGYPTPIYVRYGEGTEIDSESLNSVSVINDAQPWPMSLFVEQNFVSEPPSLIRREMQAAIVVRADLMPNGEDEQVLTELEPALLAIAQEHGVDISLGGEAEQSTNANAALTKALPAGLLLLVGCLLSQFSSLRLTGLILLIIPLAVFGVYPGLALSGQSFGFMAMLGMLGLIGVVVNNGIVLVDRVVLNWRSGLSKENAIQDAVSQRLRPILLTTLTTIIGLMPLAFSSSPLWPPLAWTMISGMLFSTLLTLIFIPCGIQLTCGERFIARYQENSSHDSGALVDKPA
ncbi:efflux RND transporter permease subunit [Thalassotalea fusca]